MAGAEEMVHVWKEWGLQVLVLLSFMLQVLLLILAEMRRRTDSGVLRVFVWSAYMLADATAIYVLGHMSVTSRSPEHELMVFWAPFLLLHLGGQDNITAYAIEDNTLWLRHLQTLIVQVTAAAYVLCVSSILGEQSLIRPATILMFLVGVVKYGERVWALRCTDISPWGKNYSRMVRLWFKQVSDSSTLTHGWDTETLLLKAHRLLDVPRELFQGPVPKMTLPVNDFPKEKLYEMVEMQLSLMHDVFYTKSKVMHTSYGLCIRIISLLAAASAFIQFHRIMSHHKGGYDTVDVSITYVLLVGAVLLEIISALRAMFSSWTLQLLVKWDMEREPGGKNAWHLFGRGIVCIRRLVRAAHWRRRYWSCSMGQHNVIQLCTRTQCMASQSSKVARWLGVEDWWNTLAYTSSIPVSDSIKQLLLNQVLKSSDYPENSPEHIMNSLGRAALKNKGLYECLGWSVDPDKLSLEEIIVVWHIATEVYLYWYKEQVRKEDGLLLADLVEAVQALSNYMLFLLAARSYMLPPPANRQAYVHMCYALSNPEHNADKDPKLVFPDLLRSYYKAELNSAGSSSGVEEGDESFRGNALSGGCHLGAKLIGQGSQDSTTNNADMLELIAQVWVEMLCYAARRCSAHSHAKQVGHGSDLVTVAALLVEFHRLGYLRDH